MLVYSFLHYARIYVFDARHIDTGYLYAIQSLSECIIAEDLILHLVRLIFVITNR